MLYLTAWVNILDFLRLSYVNVKLKVTLLSCCNFIFLERGKYTQIMIKVTYYEDKMRLKFLLRYSVQTNIFFITEEIKLLRKECIELKKTQTVFKREVKKVLMGTQWLEMEPTLILALIVCLSIELMKTIVCSPIYQLDFCSFCCFTALCIL